MLYRIDSFKGDQNLTVALNLHEYTSVETVDPDQSVDMLFPDEPYIILDRSVPVGYVIPKQEELEEVVLPDSPFDDVIGEEDFDFMEPPGAPDSGGTKGAEPDEEEDNSTDTFEAYPSISDPGKIEKSEKFKVYVGFSSELDKTLQDVQKVVIENQRNRLLFRFP